MRIAILAALALLCGGCVTTNSERMGHPEQELTAAATLNVQLGFEYLRNGRRADAVAKFEKAVEQDDDNPQAYFGLALVNDQVGDYKQAKHWFEKALSVGTQDGNIANAFGIFLCERGERAAAEEKFMSAARNLNYQTPAVAYTNAGICARKGKDPVKAEQHLRMALQSDAEHAQALLELADLSMEKGEPLRSRAFLQRLREQGPADPRTLLLSHKTEKALGDDRAAARFADELRRRFPTSAEAIELDVKQKK
jgi:type IV pilus assembly protein PilF